MNWNPGIHLFAGPTLWAAVPDADVVRHPPAAAGDLLALRHHTPCTLVLIDGYFDNRRAPWHKEIMLLLAAGFRIIGAASMGALRAAELDGCGMIGTGAIYRAYKWGLLVGDDEVAVTHAPAELDYRPLTSSLVDIRAALLDARRAGAIGRDGARALLGEARAIPFRARDARTLVALATAHGLPPDAFAPGRAGLKGRDMLDAVSMATALRHFPATATPPPPLTHHLRTLA